MVSISDFLEIKKQKSKGFFLGAFYWTLIAGLKFFLLFTVHPRILLHPHPEIGGR
jgi:hypothetical protein